LQTDADGLGLGTPIEAISQLAKHSSIAVT
jgi:hypothetical protein